MTRTSCALLTTCDVEEDRSDLLRLLDSVATAVAGGEVEHLRHFVLLQSCTPDRLNEIQRLMPDWVELLSSATPLSSSRARNVLISHYQRSEAFSPTAFVGFPDDDAWYPVGALGCLARHFGERDALEFLLARYGPDASACACGPLQRPNLQRVLSRGACAAIFVRASLLERLGGFNELLGLGSLLSGGEDTEFSIRAFHLAGEESAYLPQYIVGHAAADPAKKAKYYEGGLAAIMAHRRVSTAARIALARKLLVGVFLVLKGRLTWPDYVSAVKRARASFENGRPAPAAPRFTAPGGE